MTVYVDNFRRSARVGRNSERWSHLTADTVQELHEFAAKLGLHRDWFQTCKQKCAPTAPGSARYGGSERLHPCRLITGDSPPATGGRDATDPSHMAHPLVALALVGKNRRRHLVAVDGAHPHFVDTRLLGDHLPALTPGGPHQRHNPEHGLVRRWGRRPRPPHRARRRPALDSDDDQPRGRQAHDDPDNRGRHASDHRHLHPSTRTHRTVLAVVNMPPTPVVAVDPRRKVAP